MSFDKAPGKAELIVFRKNQFVDGGSCYIAKIDGVELGVLANGGFLRTLVDPGMHVISVPHLDDKVLRIEITAIADSTSFVEYNSALTGVGAVPAGSVVATSVSFRNSLSEVDPSYAMDFVKELKDSSNSPSCMATLHE